MKSGNSSGPDCLERLDHARRRLGRFEPVLVPRILGTYAFPGALLHLAARHIPGLIRCLADRRRLRRLVLENYI